ncbi:MAG: leucine--tRNA ligase [Bacteroidales bacterium]|nr:leucine--tRNA ligase [Bacteroidales bacterium]
MEYNFNEIEKKWQQYWAENKTYKAKIDYNKPKYYVLDMFPYPSGAGLHVGHPLGYIASDIYSRYMRLKGYNVLHPMGFDAYGLPAEQYAIQTGTHPEITTYKNIDRYKEQLNKIGFSFDWDREVRTSDPSYYKWIQWTFIQLFEHWYNNNTNRAEHINELIKEFETNGNKKVQAACCEVREFTADEWKNLNEKEQQEILMNYRLAYLSNAMVNWCPVLGTVLANDEVQDCFSERGGHPVERRLMKQWSLRITAYAQRLLDGLEKINWFESLKEMQRNWIGRSEGALVRFHFSPTPSKEEKTTPLPFREDLKGICIEVFTTRPDTLWGATFMVLAPEHELVEKITTPDREEKVMEYIKWAKNRSERERIAEINNITGEFTGAYSINPVNGKEIPIWIADYVLMGYGTGAIMAVPAHDSRDFKFARHFNIPIIQVVVKDGEELSDPFSWEDSYDSKEGKMVNSGIINGMEVKKAIKKTINRIEEMGVGYGTVNYRLRDAIFSRQRYWGEPFPIYYKNGIPYTLDESKLPLKLPEVDKYLPTESGEPPLARAKNWVTDEGYPLETNTMPGFAGSSGYYLRYMDPHNDKEYFSKKANNYWRDIDLYLGGDEHATGHLIYARFWNMFLYDLGLVCEEEPFKKLINQGKIQGRSSFVYRITGTNKFVSYNIRNNYKTNRLHVDINLVDNDILNIEAFKKWQPEFCDAEFILEEGKYICGWEIEKMSKSKHNVQNPDDLIEKYGADTFRLYEMFLGPLESHKPWDTKGIEGVFRFIKKFWRLYHDEQNNFYVSDETPTKEELKILHKTIKKIQEDIKRFSFNTVVSTFMICVNELTDLKCTKKAILEDLTVLICSYAPHIAEELWLLLGNNKSITYATFPVFNKEYIKENTFIYPVSFNGKMRFKLELPVDMPVKEIEKLVVSDDQAQKWIIGKQIRKIIIVPKKIINIVVNQIVVNNQFLK